MVLSTVDYTIQHDETGGIFLSAPGPRIGYAWEVTAVVVQADTGDETNAYTVAATIGDYVIPAIGVQGQHTIQNSVFIEVQSGVDLNIEAHQFGAPGDPTKKGRLFAQVAGRRVATDRRLK